MPRLKITVSNVIDYKDSKGRKYRGPMEGAPPYVRAAVEDMDEMMRSMDHTFSSMDGIMKRGANLNTYTMTVGTGFSWMPVIVAVSVAVTVTLVLMWRKWAG